ncbi:helix-turn-helix domain-containing protein [Paenibacillus sp. MMS20-IR301]|uniref:response regulator transcription factor n=1 Tax=Paenibacillus sp. MMS20-IR301 TaxID=2895946 RepID=UPI0028EB738A|nr:helix-turn-helix domain-containing protein [Paenibacillus sp. MMS20-IR301]WNS44113.1 response regulator [Paenibacillus sp. MMS20-IR301]
MTNVLIVDDEYYIVQDIKHSLQWSRLGITEVFTAHSMQEAIQVLSTNSIQILLSDIEMPKGSGLELLAWVNAQNLQTVNILLTSHASFVYANQAIKLGGFDYLLKPAPYEELEQALAKAVDQVNTQLVYSEHARQARYWSENRTQIAGQFWSAVVHGEVPPEGSLIRQEAAKRHVPYTGASRYRPVLIHIPFMNERADEWGRGLFEYAFKNIASEILLPGQDSPVIVMLDKNTFIALDIRSLDNPGASAELYERCQRFVSYGSKYLPCRLSCYIRDIDCEAADLHSLCGQLIEMKNNNVLQEGGVFRLQETTAGSPAYSPPEMDAWFNWIFENQREPAISAVGSYLDELVRTNKVNANVLLQFHHDFMQGVYIILKRKGILAHSVFSDPESRALLAQSLQSVSAMKQWIAHIIIKSIDVSYLVEKTSSVIERVKQYIDRNLEQEISRSTLAEHVYLNPEYLSHIFKKKTGSSLSDYITDVRIREAKRLLMTTDLPVREVSLQAGYTNLAYFSKIFKRLTSKTPLEYRRQCSSRELEAASPPPSGC